MFQKNEIWKKDKFGLHTPYTTGFTPNLMNLTLKKFNWIFF